MSAIVENKAPFKAPFRVLAYFRGDLQQDRPADTLDEAARKAKFWCGDSEELYTAKVERYDTDIHGYVEVALQ